MSNKTTFLYTAENDTMELGGLISTNNLIAAHKVEVQNTNRLLWTMSHTLLDHQNYY